MGMCLTQKVQTLFYYFEYAVPFHFNWKSYSPWIRYIRPSNVLQIKSNILRFIWGLSIRTSMYASALKRLFSLTHVRGLSQSEHFQTKASGAEQSSHGMDLNFIMWHKFYPKLSILLGFKPKIWCTWCISLRRVQKTQSFNNQNLGSKAIKLPNNSYDYRNIHRTS